MPAVRVLQAGFGMGMQIVPDRNEFRLDERDGASGLDRS